MGTIEDGTEGAARPGASRTGRVPVPHRGTMTRQEGGRKGMRALQLRTALFFLTVGLAAVIHVAPAQESRATLLGRVTDPSGAVVVGASVRAINVATNTAASSVTN